MGSVHAYDSRGRERYRAAWRGPDNKQTSKRGFETKKAAHEHSARQTVAKSDETYIVPTDAKARVGDLATAMTLDGYTDLFDDDLETLSSRLDEAIASRIVANPLPSTTA